MAKRGSAPRSASLPSSQPAAPIEVTAPAAPVATIRRRLHTLRQFQSNCNVSHSSTYKLLNSGQLKAVKILGRTMITDEEQERFLANLPAAFGDAA